MDGARDSDGRRKGGWKAADVEAVSVYLSNPAPDTVPALVERMSRRRHALEALAKAGQILEFAVAKKGVQGWVAEQFRLRGVSAEPEASALLVQLVGDDSRSLASEVDKVATWAAGEPVGEREIEMLVATTADAPTYADRRLGRARRSSRPRWSETIFERELAGPADAVQWCALGGHLGRLRALKGLASQGVRPKQAAERLKLHPFYG